MPAEDPTDEARPDDAATPAPQEPDPDAAARAALARARAAASGRGLRPGTRPRAASRPATEQRRGSQPYDVGRDPAPLVDDVERLVGQRGWSQPLAVAGVIGRWRDVVGEHVAEHCRPETFDEGALVVRADSTAWAVEVRRLVPQLERRLADEVGEGVVESITVLGPAGPTWKKGPRAVPGRGPRDTYG